MSVSATGSISPGDVNLVELRSAIRILAAGVDTMRGVLAAELVERRQSYGQHGDIVARSDAELALDVVKDSIGAVRLLMDQQARHGGEAI